MPWKLSKSGDGYFVVDNTGKKYSDKPLSKEQARKQMAALYASEPQMKAAPVLSNGLPASAFLVVDNEFKPSTWHLQVMGKDGKPDHAHMGAAWAALHGGFRGQKYEGPGKTEAISKLRKLYAQENMTPPGEKSFSVFKQADGSYRWITFSSSSYRDRDGEIISGKALADDVALCDTTKNYGPLRWWHIGGWEAPNGLEDWQTWKAGPGVDLGTCDFNMLRGRVLIESGTFKDALTGEAFAEVQDQLEVSIAFAHPVDEPKQKQFDHIHRFERSLLPEGMASNLLTKLVVSKGESSMKAGQKLKALAAILQNKPELAQAILSEADLVQKAADAAGLEYKEVEEMISAPENETSTEDQPPVEEVQTEPKEVIQPPVSEQPQAEPVEEVPQVDKAAAPPPPPAAPATPPADEIGDMTYQQLADFVGAICRQMMAGKKETDETAEAQAAALKSISDKLEALGVAVEEHKQTLQELTDARPAGIKQLMARRPTEQSNNVVKEAPTGPQIDPTFLKFLQGGN